MFLSYNIMRYRDRGERSMCGVIRLPCIPYSWTYRNIYQDPLFCHLTSAPRTDPRWPWLKSLDQLAFLPPNSRCMMPLRRPLPKRKTFSPSHAAHYFAIRLRTYLHFETCDKCNAPAYFRLEYEYFIFAMLYLLAVIWRCTKLGLS